MAFGHGVHFCLGAPLARLEGEVAVDLLLSRLADIEITPEADIQDYDNAFGAKSLPIAVRWA
jgi:cytochrome P450